MKPVTGRLVELENLGNNLYKWRAIANIKKNGKYTTTSRVFTANKTDAKTFLRDFIAEVESATSSSTQPLEEWLDYWINDFVPNNLEWEDNTYERAKRVIDKNIKPYIGHIPLGALDYDLIVSFYTTLSTVGKVVIKKTPEGSVKTRVGLSRRTVRYAHTILTQALQEAKKRNLITSVPTQEYKFTKVKASEKTHNKWVVLDRDQLAEFLSDCRGYRDYSLIYTAAYTGARESELLGLTWDRVLWDIPAIKINYTLHYNEKMFEFRPATKNDSSNRIIKITDRTVKVLKALKAEQEEKGIKANHVFIIGRKKITPDFVFLEPNGGLIKRDNLVHRFSNLSERLGYPGMTFHHLRHTHATILLSEGVYINDVSERLGHANVATTMNIYAHTLPGKDTKVADIFDKLISDDDNNTFSEDNNDNFPKDDDE